MNRLALSATTHCLIGCSIGEVAGMIIGMSAGWRNTATVVLSIVLAFVFGYSLTLRPLLASRMPVGIAMELAFASDTLSITVMEIVDNAVVLVVPGAMEAGLATWLFSGTLGVGLALGFAAAFPVNRWLIQRGKGHAVLHAHHGHGK